MNAIGITGTQHGATANQLATLTKFLRKCHEKTEWLNHGDCIGVDEQSALIWSGLGGKLRAFIPDIDSKRAFIDSDVTEKPAPYLIRNRAIVRASICMIAMPREPVEQQRGGTWSTWRYSVSQGKPTMLIFPDIGVRLDNWK